MATPSPIEKTAHYPLLRFILLGYCLLLLALAFLWDDPAHIWAGLKAIVFSSGTLLTDYMALAGIGAAFVNSAVVLLIFLAVLTLARVPMNGSVLLTHPLRRLAVGKDPEGPLPLLRHRSADGLHLRAAGQLSLPVGHPFLPPSGAGGWNPYRAGGPRPDRPHRKNAGGIEPL